MFSSVQTLVGHSSFETVEEIFNFTELMGFSFFHVVEKGTSCVRQTWLHLTSHKGQSCSQRPSYYLTQLWKLSLHQYILAEQNSIIIIRVISVPAIFHVSLPLWVFCTATFYTLLFVSKDFKKGKKKCLWIYPFELYILQRPAGTKLCIVNFNDAMCHGGSSATTASCCVPLSEK